MMFTNAANFAVDSISIIFKNYECAFGRKTIKLLRKAIKLKFVKKKYRFFDQNQICFDCV